MAQVNYCSIRTLTHISVVEVKRWHGWKSKFTYRVRHLECRDPRMMASIFFFSSRDDVPDRCHRVVRSENEHIFSGRIAH